MILSRIYFILLLFLVSGCGTKVPEPILKHNGEPNSYKAKFIKADDTFSKSIRATGENTTKKSAKEDSKKAAIWFVLFSGNDPLIKTIDEKKRFKKFAKEFYLNSNKYILDQSEILTQVRDGNNILIDVEYKVNTKLLKDDLVEKEVIKNSVNAIELFGMPTVGLYMANSVNQNVAQVNISLEHISQLLTNIFSNKIYKNYKGNKVVNNLLKLQNINDPLMASAISHGDDIYITSEVTKKEIEGKPKQFRIKLSAFYAATFKEIASISATSKIDTDNKVKSDKEHIIQAATIAIKKLEPIINKKWREDILIGKKYRVLLITDTKFKKSIDLEFYKTTKEICDTKRVFSSQTTFDHIMTCKNIRNSTDLLLELQQVYFDDGKLTRVSDNGSTLILQLKKTDKAKIIIK